jgi:8-oxo-dGTP diphosphatase
LTEEEHSIGPDAPRAGTGSQPTLGGSGEHPFKVRPAPVVAVGAICMVEGALLLVRRANPPEAGRWTIPGGRVEPGEALSHAVERETLEETAVTVRCQGLRGFAERISPSFHYVILDFDVSLVGAPNAKPGGDATEVAWVAAEDLASIDTVSGLNEFLSEHGVIAR